MSTVVTQTDDDPAPVAPDDLTGKLLDRYRIVARLGGGGMGVVWLAEDVELGRRVALKVLRSNYANEPTIRRRFLREARHSASLRHPNIAVVFDVGESDGQLFLVMEYIPGKDLRVIMEERRLTLGEVLDYLVPVARALAHAHAQDIVHRDLKPENIIVGDDGIPRLLDFGIAKLLETERRDVVATTDLRTVQGVVLGTTQYMSPEQACGGAVDKRSDVFSFGVVLHEMLARERPFKGADTVEVVQAIVRDEPPVLENAPVTLQRTLACCLAKRPNERPADGTELLRMLEQTATQTSVETRAVVLVQRGPGALRERGLVTTAVVGTTRQRRRIGIALGLTIAIVIAFVVSRSWTSRYDDETFVETVIQQSSNEVTAPSLSSDGAIIVAVEPGAVAFIPVGGSQGHKLAIAPQTVVHGAALVSEGQLLTGETDEAGTSALWIQRLDGSERRMLRRGQYRAVPSYAGDRVAYQTSKGLEVLHLASGTTHTIAPTTSSERIDAIAWAPRDDRLAWIRAGAGVPGGAVLEMASVDGGVSETVARGGDLVTPAAGASVAFRGATRLLFVRSSGEGSELWEIPLVGGRSSGTPRSIRRWPGIAVSGVETDVRGTTIVYQSRETSTDVITIPATGGEPREIAIGIDPTLRSLELETAPEWSVDGSALVFRSRQNATTSLLLRALETNATTVLVENCGDCVPVRDGNQLFAVVGAPNDSQFRYARIANQAATTIFERERRMITTPIRCSQAGCFLGEINDAHLEIRRLHQAVVPGRPEMRFPLPYGSSQVVAAFSPSPDGKAAAVVTRGDGILRTVTPSGQIREVLKLPNASASFQDVAWSPTAQHIFVSGMYIDGFRYAVITVDLDGSYKRIYESHTDYVSELRSAPDGSLLSMIRIRFMRKLSRLDAR